MPSCNFQQHALKAFKKKTYSNMCQEIIKDNFLFGIFLLFVANPDFQSHTQSFHKSAFEDVPQDFRHVARQSLRQNFFQYLLYIETVSVPGKTARNRPIGSRCSTFQHLRLQSRQQHQDGQLLVRPGKKNQLCNYYRLSLGEITDVGPQVQTLKIFSSGKVLKFQTKSEVRL